MRNQKVFITIIMNDLICEGWLEKSDGIKERFFSFKTSDMAMEYNQLAIGTIDVAIGEAIRHNIIGNYNKMRESYNMEQLANELFHGSGHIIYPVVEGTLHITLK